MGISLPVSVRVCFAVALAAVQVVGQNLTGSFPHNYPGIPNTSGNFSDSAAWQDYFLVKDPLPNITFPLQRSFAGNLPVNREGHPNNTLFFWGFETANGTLTDASSTEPWVIWLNGGPGSSSMLGLALENGPIHFNLDFTAFGNNFSWNHVADTIWIDQPVGTGWSTSDVDAFVPDEDQMGLDFFGFLENLVQVFPALATRPLYLTGESYSGVYIPYITKTYFSLANPPVSLHKIAIGDGLYTAQEGGAYPALIEILETYPQLIGYDTDVLTYFKEQQSLCGWDVNLTYPQDGLIPINVPPVEIGPAAAGRRKFGSLTNPVGTSELPANQVLRKLALATRDVSEKGVLRKRDLTGRPNGTIDPWYGCDTIGEALDYALNFSVPWAGNNVTTGFDVYYIPDALDPEAAPTTDSIGVFLNDPRVVAAVHAPTSKSWLASFTPDQGYPFGGGSNGDPSTLPMEFFSELASNLSAHGIPWILYSGNADALLPHLGTEIVIQNTTFGGIQGFTQKPSTPWFDDEGNFGGKVHQERNLTYVLFDGAGHLVPEIKPVAAFYFFREFVLGNNPLGALLPNGTTVGGTNATLAQEVLPAEHDPIFSGSGTTLGTYFYPSATIAAWDSFTATADATVATTANANASATATATANATTTVNATNYILL